MKVDGLITELRDIMETAKGMPFSGGKALVDTNNVLDIIEEIEQEFPQEFRQAKSIVADRNQIIADAKREAEEIIRAAEERKRLWLISTRLSDLQDSRQTILLRTPRTKTQR